MGCNPDAPNRINLYALVTYLPAPLGPFLNELRQELVPGCRLRSHLTILPPRSVTTCDGALKRIQRFLPAAKAIEIELGSIQIFPITQVIYLSIRRGRPRLMGLHGRLAEEELAFNEPFAYHPHITLAQGIPPDRVPEAARLARQRWAEYSGSRQFTMDAATWVQSTVNSDWLDLGVVPFGEARRNGRRTHSNIGS
jgi:2'-5' RNA ligase